MPFALELNDNIDPTALATLALAALTLVAVVIGWRSLRQTRSEIDLSRREVEEAHRPVVVPMIDHTRRLVASGVVRQVEPRFLGEGRLQVPIKNIGSGPALDVEVTVTLRNDAGEYSEAAGPDREGAIAGLGVSDLMPVEVWIPHLARLPSFDITIVYSDVAEQKWVTSAKYLAAEARRRYTELSITKADRLYAEPGG